LSENYLSGERNWALGQIDGSYDHTNTWMKDENAHFFAVSDQISLTLLALAYEVRTANILAYNAEIRERNKKSLHIEPTIDVRSRLDLPEEEDTTEDFIL